MTGLRVDATATFTAAGAETFTVDVAFDVADGERLVVLGPSGSGKTLLLETIAGFHDHGGTVELDGRRIDDVPPEKRGFGFVFQDYALFPHVTVRSNVEYGARYHDDARDADALLADLGVAHLADRYPPTLSGGEKQRVALARSLAVRPDVMLLDEPLGALDVPTRQALREDLADVLADVTTVYVTHDRTTARALADRIGVMQAGGLVQVGPPEDVFERPATPMVADFTGANVVPLADAPSLAALLDADEPPEGHVAVRPEAIGISESAGDLRATVERAVREEATNRVTLSVDDAALDVFAEGSWTAGDEVWLTVPRDRLHPC